MNPNEEVQQAINDMMGILDDTDLNWYERIAAINVLLDVHIQKVTFEERGVDE